MKQRGSVFVAATAAAAVMAGAQVQVHGAPKTGEVIEVHSCDPGMIELGSGSDLVCIDPFSGGGGTAGGGGPSGGGGGGGGPGGGLPQDYQDCKKAQNEWEQDCLQKAGKEFNRCMSNMSKFVINPAVNQNRRLNGQQCIVWYECYFHYGHGDKPYRKEFKGQLPQGGGWDCNDITRDKCRAEWLDGIPDYQETTSYGWDISVGINNTDFGISWSASSTLSVQGKEGVRAMCSKSHINKGALCHEGSVEWEDTCDSLL